MCHALDWAVGNVKKNQCQSSQGKTGRLQYINIYSVIESAWEVCESTEVLRDEEDAEQKGSFRLRALYNLLRRREATVPTETHTAV